MRNRNDCVYNHLLVFLQNYAEALCRSFCELLSDITNEGQVQVLKVWLNLSHSFHTQADPFFPARLFCARLSGVLLWIEVPWHCSRVMTGTPVPQPCRFGFDKAQLFFMRPFSTSLALAHALKLLDLTEAVHSLTPSIGFFLLLLIFTPSVRTDFCLEEMIKVLCAGPCYFINLFLTVLINAFSNVTNWTL